jgi:hypothetical protein
MRTTGVFPRRWRRNADDSIEPGPICPACGPSTGGETGDFGGSIVPCTALVAAELEQVEADGLDLAEFERRLAVPIDLPMRWTRWDASRPPEERNPVAIRGYEVDTRLVATLSTTSAFRYSYFDRALCAAMETQCSPAACSSYIVVDVRLELRTLDGAVQATTDGVAVQRLFGQSRDPSADPYFSFFNSRTDLRDVMGTLRFAPPSGSATFHGQLRFSLRLGRERQFGDMSIQIDVDGESEAWVVSGLEGEYVFPLYGSVGSQY